MPDSIEVTAEIVEKVEQWAGCAIDDDTLKELLAIVRRAINPPPPAAPVEVLDAAIQLYSAEMVWRDSSLGDNGRRLAAAFNNFFKIVAAHLAAHPERQP